MGRRWELHVFNVHGFQRALKGRSAVQDPEIDEALDILVFEGSSALCEGEMADPVVEVLAFALGWGWGWGWGWDWGWDWGFAFYFSVARKGVFGLALLWGGAVWFPHIGGAVGAGLLVDGGVDRAFDQTRCMFVLHEGEKIGPVDIWFDVVEGQSWHGCPNVRDSELVLERNEHLIDFQSRFIGHGAIDTRLREVAQECFWCGTASRVHGEPACVWLLRTDWHVQVLLKSFRNVLTGHGVGVGGIGRSGVV